MGWRASTLRICAFISLFSVASTLLAQSVSDATNIDSRWNRTWPAGPFSQVSTSWGILQTSIPLCSVEGPGGTSIGFSLYHRSNQNAGAQLAYGEGTAGRGWTTSVTQTIQAGTGATTWYQGANSTASWTIASMSGSTPTYARTTGTRADLVPYMVGSQIQGWDVTTQGDKTVYKFRQEVVDQVVYRLTQIVDTHGNTVNFTYDANDRVTQVTDASGVRNIQIGYTADAINKQVSWVKLNYPGGSRQWDFWYSNWHLGQIDYPAPVTGGARPNVKFHYTSNTNLDQIDDLRGSRWFYSYTNLAIFGGLQAITGFNPPQELSPLSMDATGTEFSWTLYTSGPAADWTKTCTINDRRNWNWKHVYYNNGSGGNDWFTNPIKSVYDGGFVSNDLYTWNYTDGTLTTYTDRRGWNTSFTYDSRGNMLTKTDREGWLWRWIYYQDKVVTQIDPTLNRTTLAYYTPSWDIASVTVDPKTDPFDGSYNKPTGVALKTNYTYNSTGDLMSQWAGTDTPIQYSNFDAYGNAQTVTEPSGYATTFTFDHLNNKLTEAKPSPQGTTNYAYDNWDRLTRVTHPGGSYTESTYDNNDNKLTVRNENGFTTTHYYNVWNWYGGYRQQVDANSVNDIIVEYFYDDDGHRIRVENGRDKSTYYDTDSRGLVWRIRYPDSTNRQFTYDGNGNIATRTDGKGQVTTFVCDKEDRITQRKYGSTVDFTNSWRSDGLLSQRVDATGTYNWNFNGAKQLTSTVQPVPNKTVTYTYDAAGRRKTMAVGSMTWTYNYGTNTRLSNIQQTVGASTAVTHTYNPDGSLLTRTFGNNAQILRPTYDTRGRTTVLSYRSISGGVETERQRIEYTYDDAGNILTYRNNGSGGGGNNWLTTNTFDRANRLKTEIRTGGSAHNFNIAYNYDKSNNRTSVVRNGSSSTYTVDDNDKFLTGDGFTASSYDNDGNPGTLNWPGRGNYNFTYNKEQKPTTIVAGSLGTWTHTYDGEGRRVKLVSPSGERRYVFDGATVIAETDASGNILTYHLPDVGWIESGTQRFYRQNQLGSNLSVLDSTGAKVSESEFDGYGNEYTIQSGPQNQYGFAGKHGYQTDANDLQLLGARFYVAPLGRFLTQDPIGQEGGLNIYAYCENNPLSKVDPDGKQSIDSVNSTVQQQIARAAVSTEERQGALQFLREMLGESNLSRTAQNIVKNGIRQILRSTPVDTQRGFLHSFKHLKTFLGRTATVKDVAEWKNIVGIITRSKNMFDGFVGGSNTIAFIGRYRGLAIVVHYFKDGPRAGEIATMFQPNNEQFKAMMEAARQFVSGK